MMLTSEWTRWGWKTDPGQPRGWENPAQAVVLVDDWLADPPHPSRDGAGEAIASLPLPGPVLVCTESVSTLRSLGKARAIMSPRKLPALRVERQDDLLGYAGRSLMAVNARHRALVVVPRGPVQIQNGREDRWNFPTRVDRDGVGVQWVNPGDAFVGPDLVVVHGPTGPGAWPLDPTWVRSVRDQCAAAGVAFAFLGWGHVPPQVFLRGATASHLLDLTDEQQTLCGQAAHRFEPEPERTMDGRCCQKCRPVYGARKPSRVLDGVEHHALPAGL